MNTYHCTRNQPYQNPLCLGHNNPEVRQGYYVDAASEQEAIALMQQMFADDSAGFTAELWIDDFSEPQPDDSEQYLYRLYRKPEFLFIGGEPLAEQWGTQTEASDANDLAVQHGLIWVKASD